MSHLNSSKWPGYPYISETNPFHLPEWGYALLRVVEYAINLNRLNNRAANITHFPFDFHLAFLHMVCCSLSHPNLVDHSRTGFVFKITLNLGHQNLEKSSLFKLWETD